MDFFEVENEAMYFLFGLQSKVPFLSSDVLKTILLLIVPIQKGPIQAFLVELKFLLCLLNMKSILNNMYTRCCKIEKYSGNAQQIAAMLIDVLPKLAVQTFL